MSSTEYYSSDDCWDGEHPPRRASFEGARPRKPPYAGLDYSEVFWEGEPEGGRKYEVLKRLGKGQYGTVVSAQHRRTGKACAIKHISGVFAIKDDAIKTLRELRFLRVFQHPNVVGLHDVLVPRDAQGFNDVYLVTELMETDLDKLIKSKTVLEDQHIRWIIYQLLRALAYVHGANVSHRDVKPANIVVDSQCNVKLCDFGLSRADFPRESDTPIFWTDYVATRWYRAPELLCSHNEQYTTQIDMWAAGCIMGELVKRRPMFPGRNVYHQIDLVTTFCGTPSPSTIDKMRNQRAREHLMRQLPPKPHENSSSKFPTLGDDGLSMLHGLLSFDPNDRTDAATSCQHIYFKQLRESIDEGFIAPSPQMAEADFAWEDEDLHTTTELRRKLYDEILAFHPEALARGIAAAAKKATSEDHEATERRSPSPRATDRVLVERTPSSGVFDALGEVCSSDTGVREPEQVDKRCASAELDEHRVEPPVPTGSREEQWGHLRMGIGTGDVSTDCEYSSDDGEHGHAALAPSGTRRRCQRTPSMCSLTSGSDNSEPISTVSDHVWSSHECHTHHLFHVEPALPKFMEETGDDSPGGLSGSDTDGSADDADEGVDEILVGAGPSPSNSRMAVRANSPERQHAETPTRKTSSTVAGRIHADHSAVTEAIAGDLKCAGCAGKDIGTTLEMHHELKMAFHEVDKFVDTSFVASQPIDIGDGKSVALPREPSKDIVPELRVANSTKVEERPKVAKPSRENVAKSKNGRGGTTCCGSNPKQRNA